MSRIGFHVDSCSGLPPGAMMAASVDSDGLLHVAVRTESGKFVEKKFNAQQLAAIIDRATIEFWESLKLE